MQKKGPSPARGSRVAEKLLLGQPYKTRGARQVKSEKGICEELEV